MTPRRAAIVLGSLLLLLSLAAAQAVADDQGEEERGWTDLDGHTWTDDDLRGRIVVLHFWATWCTPCRAELPTLRGLHERLTGDDTLVLGVALDTIDRRRLRSFLRRHAIDWPQIHAPQGPESAIARQFGVDTVPSTRILDREGRVVARDLHGRRLEVVVESVSIVKPGFGEKQ